MKKEKKKYDKRKLQIQEIKEPKPFGQDGKTLLPTTATDLSLAEDSPLHGRYLTFNIFNPTLKDYITGLGDKFPIDIIADYDEPIPEEGDDWMPPRAITQIYGEDGQPVAAKRKSGYGKSPEIVRLEHELDLILEDKKRISIEGQKAVEQVCELLKSGNLEATDGLIGKSFEALNLMLDRFIFTLKAKTEILDKKPKPTKPPDAKLAKKTENATDTIKNVGDLLTRASHLEPPVSRVEVIEVLSVNDPKEIKDLDKAWTDIQKYSKSKREKLL